MATQAKKNLKVGQKVKFFRPNDKATPLTGTITKIYDGDDDVVDIKTDAGNGSVSRVETAHAPDVTVVTDVTDTAKQPIK